MTLKRGSVRDMTVWIVDKEIQIVAVRVIAIGLYVVVYFSG
jgi:hypothetical protein